MVNFIVSIDYELGWGLFDKAQTSYLCSNVRQSSAAAIRILDIHKRLDVPATWAIVGLAIPAEAGVREKTKLLDAEFSKAVSATQVFSKFGDNEARGLLEIPPFVIEEIRSSKNQEIASHTFSHIYAIEADRNKINRDFDLMVEACSREIGLLPISLVMPKNQVTDDAVRAALNHGIKIIRVNPGNWLYKTRKNGPIRAQIIRLLRFLDAFLPLNELFMSRTQDFEIKATEGNFFFRPVCSFHFLDYVHFLRFKIWVYFCGRYGRDIHLWSHPHNFGSDVERAIRNYERILQYMTDLRRRQKVEVKNMKDLTT